MRKLVLVSVMVAACGNGKAADESAGGAGASAAPSAGPSSTKPGRAALALDHVTLLQPDATIEKRVKDQDDLAGSLKRVPELVAAYDEAHPGALPASFDVVLVARSTAMRAWLVGERGDISAPDLERAIASMPRFAVTEGNVGVVLSVVRAGTQPTQHGPYMPATWKAAAGDGGSEVDQVIDKAWPR